MSSKSDLTPDRWRERFQRSYETDQCYPAAVHAALRSADHVLGTDIAKRNDLKAVSRRMGYRRRFSTPADAMQNTAFRRFLGTYGLQYAEESKAPDPIKRLRELARSDDVSFPLVSVHLEFLTEHRGVQLKGVDLDLNSHAVLVLKVGEDDVDFFDGNFQPERLPGVRERMPLVKFLSFWERDPYRPLFVEYITRKEKAARPPPRSKAKTIESYVIGGKQSHES